MDQIREEPLPSPTRWPETENYLERVGQINNDLMLAREIAAREAMIPTWMDQLGIGANDLIEKPEGMNLIRLLHRSGIRVKTAEQLPDWIEVWEDQLPEYRDNYQRPMEFEDFLEDVPTLGPQFDEQLFALPELESQLSSWARSIMQVMNINEQDLTMPQLLMFARLIQYLLQESTLTHGWAVESVRSLLSEPFFESAGNPPLPSAQP